jgi:ribonuclease HIII
MIARPSIPSTYSPRGMSRRRRPEDAPITISGNDSAGIGNTQSNIARQVIYDNTRTNVHIVLNVEDAKQLSEVKAQGIVQRLNVLTPAYANLVESHKRKSCQQRGEYANSSLLHNSYKVRRARPSRIFILFCRQY